jgi:protein-L-isoaspartate(D-aspartate) O-methyltransferase
MALTPTALLWLAVGLLFAVLFACGPERTAGNGQGAPPQDDGQWQILRQRMVDEQLRARDIRSPTVLAVMERVPRHRFVPATVAEAAYEDHPLPIGQGQTISQPYILAYMTEALAIEPSHRVLEIGTGSGYQAAVLAELAREVYSIEIVPELGERARKTLSSLGYENVQVRIGNGYEGWPEHAPFDGIIVTAAPDAVPPKLLEQLAVGGRMVVPVGTGTQELLVLTKTPEGVSERRTVPVLFVPMIDKPAR